MVAEQEGEKEGDEEHHAKTFPFIVEVLFQHATPTSLSAVLSEEGALI